MSHEQPDSWNGSVRRGWTILRWALLAAVLATSIAGVVLGERTTASYGDLQQLVASGDVDTVEVSGLGLRGPDAEPTEEPGPRDVVTVTVRWHDGLFDYRTTVVERGARATEQSDGSTDGSDGEASVLGTVADDLRDLDPDVLVETSDDSAFDEIGGPTFLGFELPGWTTWVVLVVALASLFLLVNGPRPWRATRWAWFWLLGLAPPVGILAFLLLSAPIRPLPRPRPGALPFTGGWAFILTVLGNGVLSG